MFQRQVDAIERFGSRLWLLMPNWCELLGFPGSAHDDQVDATAQLLLWVQDKDRFRTPCNAGPIEVDSKGMSSDPINGPESYDRDPWGA